MSSRDETKAEVAIMHWIGHETAHLSRPEQYRVMKAVAYSCQQSADEIYKETLAEYQATRPRTGAAHET
jgi:hypothetical protein